MRIQTLAKGEPVIQTMRQGGGGGGSLQKTFFSLVVWYPQFGIKIRWGRNPRTLPWVCHWKRLPTSTSFTFTDPLFSPQKPSFARIEIKTAGDLLIPRATGWGCVKVISLCISIFCLEVRSLGEGRDRLRGVKWGNPHFYPYSYTGCRGVNTLMSFTPLSRTIPPHISI